MKKMKSRKVKKSSQSKIDSIKKPTSFALKVTTSWAEKLVITLLSLLAGILVFPLSLWCLLPMLLLFFLAIVSIIVTKKIILTKLQKRGLVILAILCFLMSISWGILYPLLAFDSITYVVVLPEQNPFDAKLIKVKLPKQNISIKIVALSDPLRPYLLHIIKYFRPLNHQVIDIQKVANDFYLVPPLQTCLIHAEPTTSASSLRVKQIMRFYDFSPDIDMQMVEGGKWNSRMGISLKSGFTISNTYNTNSTTPFWHAVNCGHKITGSSITYVALLDYALTVASLARTEEAFAALHEAGRVVPSDIEHVRLTSLLAHWSKMRFGGTLGCLQSASYYKEATNSLITALKRQHEFSNHDQLVLEWAHIKILAQLSKDKNLFSQELKKVNFLSLKSKYSKFVVSKDDNENNNIRKSFAELYKGGFYGDYVAKVCKLNIEEFQAESIRASRNKTNARLFFEAAMTSPSIMLYANDKTKLKLYFSCINRALRAAGNPWLESLTPFVQTIERVFQNYQMDILDQNTMLTVNSEDLNFLHLPLLSMIAGHGGISKFSPSFIPDPPNSEWWTNEFIDWFLFNVFVLMVEKKQESNKGISVYCLIRDHAGSGTLFLPGLAIAYVIADHSGGDWKDYADKFELEFSRNVGMPPYDYFRTAKWSSLPAD